VRTGRMRRGAGEVPLQQGAFYVFDKGYCDYNWWHRIETEGARFVTRFKFLRRLKLASPIKITKILTDNGSQFTDRFAMKDKKPKWPACVRQGLFRHGYRALPGATPVTLKPTAWWSDSTAVSASYCSRPASTAGPIWIRPCSTT
jgi:hypothetical protein